MLNYTPDQLRRVGETIFRAAGASEANAARVTEALIDANLAGHDSHGVLRIPQYLDSIRAGEIIPDATPRVLQETPTSALVDGGWTFGQVGAEYATRKAVEKAKEGGVAAVGVVRVHHIGRLGEYAELAAREGVIAMVFAGGFGGSIGAAPYGGAGIAFSTNPLSFAFPTGERPVVMSDFATTAVAAGKIRLAKAKGESLPPGCIVDREGKPSTDPDAFYDGGFLLPFGGHKGYALGVVVELLGQAMTGADAYAEGNLGGDIYGHSGTLIVALDPGLFRPRDEYARRVDATVDRIKGVPPAPGFNEVLLPGEPELRARKQRQAEGIPVAERTWEEIRTHARGYGLDVDALVG